MSTLFEYLQENSIKYEEYKVLKNNIEDLHNFFGIFTKERENLNITLGNTKRHLQ